MADWIIEPLAKVHKREGFSCGKSSLDDFIHARVSQYEKRRLGRTFVAVPPESKSVIGYYTLAPSAVSFANMLVDVAKKLPKHPVPVVLLARLAVDLSFHGRRQRLLLDALQRSLDLSAELRVHAVEVDAIDDTAAAFYRKYGFTPLVDQPLHLFLPISTIEKALG